MTIDLEAVEAKAQAAIEARVQWAAPISPAVVAALVGRVREAEAGLALAQEKLSRYGHWCAAPESAARAVVEAARGLCKANVDIYSAHDARLLDLLDDALEALDAAGGESR
jgi:hypothetical protein